MQVPEGKLTIDGPMQPFLSGVGLLALEVCAPVVPMHLAIHRSAPGIIGERWSAQTAAWITVTDGRSVISGCQLSPRSSLM